MIKFTSIEAAHKNVKKELTQIRNATIIETFNKLVEDAPVGKPETWKHKAPPGYSPGHYRANWQISRRNPATSEINSTSLIPTAEHINQATFGETIYITNNAPYAERLENGWSQQRPSGWVRRIVAMGERLLEKFTREIGGK